MTGQRGDGVRRQQQGVVVDPADGAVARAVLRPVLEPECVEVGREPVRKVPVVGVLQRRPGQPRRGQGAMVRARGEAQGRCREGGHAAGHHSRADLRGAQHEFPACQRWIWHRKWPSGLNTRTPATERCPAGVPVRPADSTGCHASRPGAPPRNPVGRGPYGDRVMAKTVTSFSCTSCGQVSLRWMGRCPGCGEWNTLIEEAARPQADGRVARRGRSSGGTVVRASRGRAPQARGAGRGGERRGHAAAHRQRRARPGAGRRSGPGLGGADRRISGHRQEHPDERRPGEHPVCRRPAVVCERRGVGCPGEAARRAPRPHALAVPVLAETSLEAVLATLEQERPQACVIDSVQTLWSADLTGSPGSVGQVQEVAAALERFARERLRRDPRRPRHEGRHTGRARACSSTSSTACCSSKATASAATASCAR